MQTQTSPSENFSRLGSILAKSGMAIGIMVMLGWFFGLELLKNPFPDEGPVAISTAICLILSSLGVLCIKSEKPILARVCNLATLSICLIILSYYLFRTFDLDNLFHGAPLPAFGPDRMSPVILIALMSINVASLLNPKRHKLIDFLVLFTSVLCMTAFAAHFFEVPKLMRTRTLIQMASPTALAGIFIGWALLFIRPQNGSTGVLSSTSMGGKISRQYILAAIVMPFVVGRVALNGNIAGLYDPSLGAAMVVIFTSSCLVSLLWRVSGWLNEADYERDRAQEEMRNNIESTRLIVEAANDAFVMMDKQGKIIDWNPAAEQLLGWHRAEALGQTMDFMLAKQDRSLHLANLDEYNKSGKSDSLNRMIELNLIRKDESEFTAEGSPFAVLADGETRLCAFLHDISSRKESERRINEFVSTVSHELRTPLTSIKGALRLIEGGIAGDVSEEAMSLINVATSETERLIRLVNDILDMKKIEAGKLELSFSEVDLARLANETIEGISGMAGEFGIILAKEISATGNINCDRDRITQVLNNLISNAIKFSPEGETVTIKIDEASPLVVRFSVIDSGSGIPENQVHKLFGRFQQLDSSDSRQQGGTGLGLAISKAIVEQHHGKIGLQSSYREGSTFWIELPRVQP